MQDADLEAVYKAAINISHYAGLRACFDAGWDEALSITITPTTQDASQAAPAPTVDPTVMTP